MVEEKQFEDHAQSPDWWSLTRKSNILLTEKLILRKLQQTDAKPMAQLANNANVATMTARLPYPYSMEDAQEFIARSSLPESRGCTYAITLAKTAEFIGCCALSPSRRRDGPALGYWLGEPFWGYGYATEAAHAMVDLAFKATDRERVNASCRVVNPASRRVLEKCGFQRSESGMIQSLAANSSVPVDYYVLDRTTWISLKSWGDNL